jgi:hypothetical protein
MVLLVSMRAVTALELVEQDLQAEQELQDLQGPQDQQDL